MPNLGQQLSNGGALIYFPRQKNRTAMTTAHATEYINRVRDLVRSSGVANLRNARLSQMVTRRDVLNQNQLLANRQARIAELAEAQGRYFNQFGSVLNDKALSFLDEMSSISAPTFTAILAGYEHARASHADMEQARIKEYERVMNMEHELAKERVALRRQEMQNEISVAQAMNNQIMQDAQNYWQISKDAVQMYGGKVNVPEDETPTIIGGGGYRGAGRSVTSGGGTTAAEKQKAELQDALAIAGGGKKTESETTKSAEEQKSPEKTPEQTAQENVSSVPGLNESIVTWVREGWDNDAPPEDSTGFWHNRESDASKLKWNDIYEDAKITDESKRKYKSDYDRIQSQVNAINEWMRDEKKTGYPAQFGITEKDIIDASNPGSLAEGLFRFNQKISSYKQKKQEELPGKLGTGTRKPAAEESAQPAAEESAQPADKEEKQSVLQRLNETLNPFYAGSAYAGEAATSTENPTGTPTSEGTGLPAANKTGEETSAPFLENYIGDKAPLRYRTEREAQALKDINALYRSGKLNDKNRQQEITELLEAGERPSDIFESLNQGTTSRYTSELRVKGDLSKYRRQEDFSESDPKKLGKLYDGTMTGGNLHGEGAEMSYTIKGELYKKYPGLRNDIIREVGSNRGDDSATGEILQRYRKTDAEIEEKILPRLKTEEELNAFYRLSRGIGVGTKRNNLDQRRLLSEDVDAVAKLLEQGVPADRIAKSLEHRGAVQGNDPNGKPLYKPIVDEKGNFIEYKTGQQPKALTPDEAKKVEKPKKAEEAKPAEEDSAQAQGQAQAPTQATEQPAEQAAEPEYQEDQVITVQEDDSPDEEELRAEAERRRAERAERYALETEVFKYQMGSPEDAVRESEYPVTETSVYGRPRNEVRVGDPAAIRAAEADDRARWTFRRDQELKAEQDRLVEETYRAYESYLRSPDFGPVDFESIPGPARGTSRMVVIPGENGSSFSSGGEVDYTPQSDYSNYNIPPSKNLNLGGANFEKLHPAMKNRVNTLADNLKNDFGITLYMSSGYRTPQEQARIIASGKGYMPAAPGRSPHNFGMGVDIHINSRMRQQYNNSPRAKAKYKTFQEFWTAETRRAGLYQFSPTGDPPHLAPIRTGRWGEDFNAYGRSSKKKIETNVPYRLSVNDPLANLGKGKRRAVWGGNTQPVDFVRRTPAISEYLSVRAKQMGISNVDALSTAYNLVQNMLLMGESAYGNAQSTNKSTGKGLFMILNGTFSTIKNAARSYRRKYGYEMDAFFNRLARAQNVFDLSPYDQATMSLLASDFPGVRRNKSNVYFKNMVNAIENNDLTTLKKNMLGLTIDNHWAGGNHPHRAATIELYTRQIDDILRYMTKKNGRFI